MAKFQIVSKYENSNLILPTRATKYSAGYDMAAAEDTVIPSIFNLDIFKPDYLQAIKNDNDLYNYKKTCTLERIADLTKYHGRPTLVSTGVKCQLEGHSYLKLVVRSSTPLKHWIILANSEGIIDADYYNNPDNEGEIFFQLINLSPFDILIQKGDKIGQGIISFYDIVSDDSAIQERTGGFGSTDNTRA